MPKTDTQWRVFYTGKARKQKNRLPKQINAALALLEFELKQKGPELTNWPHYGKIKNKKDFFHCHLNNGRPRYVAVWKKNGDEINLIEVRYVGTHEGINYDRID